MPTKTPPIGTDSPTWSKEDQLHRCCGSRFSGRHLVACDWQPGQPFTITMGRYPSTWDPFHGEHICCGSTEKNAHLTICVDPVAHDGLTPADRAKPVAVRRGRAIELHCPAGHIYFAVSDDVLCPRCRTSCKAKLPPAVARKHFFRGHDCCGSKGPRHLRTCTR